MVRIVVANRCHRRCIQRGHCRYRDLKRARIRCVGYGPQHGPSRCRSSASLVAIDLIGGGDCRSKPGCNRNLVVDGSRIDQTLCSDVYQGTRHDGQGSIAFGQRTAINGVDPE